ncbi:RluA family pseudouridine synthase, partial [Brevundimonas sp.]
MADEPIMTDEDNTEDMAGGEALSAEITASGIRLDKALSEAFPTLSRARLQALLAEGAVSKDGQVLTSGKAKAATGTYTITLPPVAPAEPQPENIPLTVLYEDAHLVVIDKPSGMAAHPAPGCETGTLVNALLYHCGDTLSGIGGVARPGIVHRLDKDTSGVMVAAKTDEAHQGLSALFATHDIERTYIALTRGTPNALSGRIDTQIGRSLHDRKKMAVLKHGGRQAITDYV